MSDPKTDAPTAPESSVGLMADPRTTVERLLHSEDETRVKAIMRSLTPEQAAHLVQYAPTSSDKARLLGAMERLQRAETLDHVAPTLFATLVENPETETDYLLGEVSLDRFRELLALCSPEQRFYWVSRAAAHNDIAAQLLTLLLPPKDLAEMLLTVPDFRKYFVALRTYEPGQFEEVPCKDPRLKAVLQFMADFDTDIYKTVMHAARDFMDWEHVNKEVTEEFVEPSPLRDFEKYEAPDAELVAEVSHEVTTAQEEVQPSEGENALQAETVETTLAQTDFTALTSNMLTAERFQEIQSDLDAMIHREIVDAGGSFSPEALEQASGRVHCYLHFGLVRLAAGNPKGMARLLMERSLVSVMQAGMEYIEAIRQRALRIASMRDWFDKEQQVLLDGLLHPRVGTTPGSRTEYIFKLPSSGKRKEDRTAILISEAPELIEETAGWVTLAKRMPEGLIRRSLASSPAGAQAFLGALAVAVTLYRRWDPTLIDLQDVYDFHDRMVDPAKSDLTAPGKEALDTAAERWAKAQELNEEEAQRVGLALVGAGERLAEWLTRYPRPKLPQCKPWVYLANSSGGE
jgi:hypothetical protein